MLSTNQTLHKGRYRVINQFTTNSGHGMYEAYDTVSDSNVVLKECIGPQAKVSTPSQREASDAAFFGAAKTLSEFKHSSLVSVHDYFSDIGRQYLVLESVEGFDLNKYLDPASARLELSVVLKWADQLLNALHFLHKLSPPVIHGDIQPENIRFTPQGDLKLLAADLNSTANGVGADQDASGNYQPFEKVWMRLDSPAQQSFLKDYDARAERLLRGPADARSDLYSVGACIYQLLSGVMPVDSLERATAMRDKKPDPLKKLTNVASGVPIEISDAVMKALEIKREFRFYSAAVMAQVLRTAVVKVAERSSEGIHEAPLNGSDPVQADAAEVLTDSFVHAIPDFAPSGADARQRELEEEQLRLEAEQKRIEERREAIGAERARLEREAELERLSIEQERRAEERRLLEAKAEQERANAANRLAEMEAEKQKHLLEAERQEQEAEQERLRAEKKLAELHAERERRLEEEQTAAAAVREELERAEQRLLELSHLESPVELHTSTDPFEDDLLELESSTPPASAASSVPKALEVLADKPFEGFGPTRQVAERDFAFQDFENSSTSFGWKIPAIGAAVAVLIAMVLGWSFLGSNEPIPSTAVEVQSNLPGTQPIQQPAENLVTIEQPAAVPEQSPVVEQPTIGAYSTDREVNLGSSQKTEQLTTRPTGTVKTAEKPKKVAAANKPTPKKLTVDDLINDN